MLPLVLLSFVSITDALLGFIGTTQSVAVVGQLRCNGYPAGSVKVKLYDVNTFTIDNFLSETHSDNNGNFGLSGKETDITTMDPKFNIYHKCNYNGICYQKVAITIPHMYVNQGTNPQRPYDAGVIELGGKFSGQSVDCLNKK